jgi:hypothetical protein
MENAHQDEYAQFAPSDGTMVMVFSLSDFSMRKSTVARPYENLADLLR